MCHSRVLFFEKIPRKVLRDRELAQLVLQKNFIGNLSNFTHFKKISCLNGLDLCVSISLYPLYGSAVSFEFWVRIRVRLRRRLVTFNDDIVLSVYVIFYNFQSMYKSN